VLEEPVEIGNNVEDKLEIGRSKKDIEISEIQLQRLVLVIPIKKPWEVHCEIVLLRRDTRNTKALQLHRP